jgi:hypothetical protein
MGQRVPLCRDLDAGSDEDSIRIRAAAPPFKLIADGGFTGSVTVQETRDPLSVADAACTWITVATLTTSDTADVDNGVYRIRVSGTHTAGTANVDLIESFQR